MPRQQTENYEIICISNFLKWYNNKFQTRYKCYGRSRDIYASELRGKKDWDWVCRDVDGNNLEMAVEILSVSFEEPSIRRGVAYNVFCKTKTRLDCHLPGCFFLRFPDALTVNLLARQEQQLIIDQLVNAIEQKFKELDALPEWYALDIQVGNNTFKLQKCLAEGCTFLAPLMATAFNANTDEIKVRLARKIPEKNQQLKIAHDWGLNAILLIQSSGVPHHTELIDIICSIDTDKRSNIDKIYIVRIDRPNNVFEV